MKKHVVIARFDDAANAVLNEWKAMADKIQNTSYEDSAAWPPHISIAAYEDVNISKLCDWVSEYTSKNPQIEVCFASLGVFAHGRQHETDVIYASPANSIEFTNFYYGFHSRLDEFAGEYGRNYTAKYKHPVFHSTITVCSNQDFNSVFDRLREEFHVIKGKITALEIYENPIKLICRYELR